MLTFRVYINKSGAICGIFFLTKLKAGDSLNSVMVNKVHNLEQIAYILLAAEDEGRTEKFDGKLNKPCVSLVYEPSISLTTVAMCSERFLLKCYLF